MDYFTVLFSCLILLPSLLSLILLSRKRNDAAWKLPPSPTKLPLVGNLHQFGNLPHNSLHKLSRKYGPLMYLKLGSIPTVVASSADTAKEFLKTHDLECCSRPFVTSLEKLSYGFCDIAFAPYGEQWRELRKICILQLFNTKKVASFRCIREDEVERMVNYMSLRCNLEINLSEELLLLANNITCRGAVGKRYYSGGTSDRWRLYEILIETQALFAGFFYGDFIPMLGWLDTLTGMRGRLEKNFQDLNDFYQKVIDDHLDPARENDRIEDIIDTLLDMQKTTSHITDDHIKGVLMNIFVGGSNTSSAAIEWAMAELMRRPEAMKKVQDEVRGLIGNKGKVDESDLDQLLYLKSVVKETMRLHPPVPLLVQRETILHCKINGYDIPAKTRLLINNIFVGGSDTSSAAIEWAMTELVRKPEAMKKVQDEVRGLIGNKGKVDESDLDQLLYLKSVVKETMRLHPPVPLLVQRETILHCKINGYDIPAKTRLLINARAIGRDPYIWEKPDEFYPERFINSPIDFTGHDFQFIPFGAGRRICPGMHSGILVVYLALANLLYHFDWELPKGLSKEDIDMSESPGVTVHRKSALYLVAKKYP